jgi:hypothetical protein
MPAEPLTVYESWDLTLPEVSERSCLYHLKPIGLGTPWVETLASYIFRLAKAHGMTLNDFVKEVTLLLSKELKEIIYQPATKSLLASWLSERDKFFSASYALKKLIQALEKLTLRQDLHFLTLLSWGKFPPSASLLRQYPAWCLDCYEEWKQRDEVIYQPLILSMKVIEICPRHHRQLRFYCQHCGNYQSLLPPPWFPGLGYCTNCSQWLGTANERIRERVLEREYLQWQLWVTETVGQLLAATSSLDSPVNITNLKQTVKGLSRMSKNLKYPSP